MAYILLLLVSVGSDCHCGNSGQGQAKSWEEGSSWNREVGARKDRLCGIEITKN